MRRTIRAPPADPRSNYNRPARGIRSVHLGENVNINGGLPYLLDNPPRMIAGKMIAREVKGTQPVVRELASSHSILSGAPVRCINIRALK